MERGSGEEITVLHVDDDSSLADLIATYLQREDDRFSVETATTVDEGLKYLGKSAVDCIVSDYDMPGGNGIEFLKAVRERYPDLPFILYTGKGSEEVASEAISAGVTEYLQKESGTSQYAVLANRIGNVVRQSRSQRDLEETQRKLSQLAEKSDDILFMFNSDWSELLFINSAYEDIWGGSISDVKSDPESFLAHIHPEDRERTTRSMETVANGEPDSIEYRIIRSNGEMRWVRSEGKPIFEAESVSRIVGYVRDITEQKEREGELKSLYARFERFGKHVRDALFFVSTDYSETLYANPAVETIYGITPEEAYEDPTSWMRYIHPDDRTEMVEGLEKQQEQALDWPVEQEFRIQHPERGVRWIQSRLEQVTDDEGVPVEIAGVATDITESKAREQTLKRERDKFDEFASVVSHDLRFHRLAA
ncbi:PAS domain-containing protein [Halostagnicola sp. A56]|uniref:PAS domain-containing response regulator n=1 Tax=Halostagnicola sp. A56 TaxID=1495067 RepID=UPI000678DEFF|nr:PAS domain-containing protein [Halostagnicola sp. A56]